MCAKRSVSKEQSRVSINGNTFSSKAQFLFSRQIERASSHLLILAVFTSGRELFELHSQNRPAVAHKRKGRTKWRRKQERKINCKCRPNCNKPTILIPKSSGQSRRSRAPVQQSQDRPGSDAGGNSLQRPPGSHSSTTTEPGSAGNRSGASYGKKQKLSISDRVAESASYSMERWQSEQQRGEEPWKAVWTFKTS